ncbi:MAG: dihydroorotate dehydrogenase [bacterium]|nr:dihydroorotate dehydrogenase [bacterium]
MRRRRRHSVDLRVFVGAVEFPNPVLCASGTAGYGTELSGVMDMAAPGAVVVKSLSAEPWPGNPAPRVDATPAGMINSVGLQGPGVVAWAAEQLPALQAAGVRVVASIWGRTIEEYRRAAELLAPHRSGILALEVNLSCPNLEEGEHLFARAPESTAAAVEASAIAGLPLWAKLSLVAPDIVTVAAAAREAGAAAVTLINTVPGMVIDVAERRPVLGAGPGGVSGPAIRPQAVRAIWECHAALGDLPIVGVGGVARGADAVEMLMAGASAVQVGTATFASPRAPERVCAELTAWCRRRGVASVRDLTGAAHRPGRPEAS